MRYLTLIPLAIVPVLAAGRDSDNWKVEDRETCLLYTSRCV